MQQWFKFYFKIFQMNKTLLFTSFLFFFSFVFTQKNASIVPDSSNMVSVINFSKILKSISLEELEENEFINSAFHKVFKTTAQDVKMSKVGIDFTSNGAVFSGTTYRYDFMGVSMVLNDENQFFANQSINDDRKSKLKKQGYLIENEDIIYFHQGNFIYATIDLNENYIKTVADSIFDANEWEKPYYWWDDYSESSYNYEMGEAMEEIEAAPYEEHYIEDEQLYEENLDEESIYEEEHIESPEEKHNRVKDSLRNEFKTKFKKVFVKNIKDKNQNMTNNSIFKTMLNKNAAISVFIDPNNTNTFTNDPFLRNNPIMKISQEMLKESYQVGYLDFMEDNIEINWEIHANDDMMQVVRAGSRAKFDKNLLNYIPNYNQGFIVHNINGLASYEKIKSIYMPQLDASDDPQQLMISAVWSLIDEAIDDESFFDMIGADMMFTFNGLTDMEFERTTYDYDEETFEYIERKEKYIDKIPSMTLALSSSKSYIADKFMKALSKMPHEHISNEGSYYTTSGFIPGVPFYLAIIDDIILFTNEEALVKHNLSGYGKQALGGDKIKKAKKPTIAYGNFDWQAIPNDLITLTTNAADKKLFEDMRSKTGAFEFEIGDITDSYYSMSMVYTPHETYKNGVYYFIDFLTLFTDR